MTFFNKKQSKINRNCPSLVLCSDENGSVYLAFGLQWRSIVTSGGKDACLKLVKKAGGSHFIYKNNQQMGFGFIDSKKENLTPGTLIYPAAQIAARLYGGNAILAFKIADGEYWFAIIRNGIPTSIDKFINSDNDYAIKEEVKKSYESAKNDSVELAVYTNVPNLIECASIHTSSPADLLLSASTGTTDALESSHGLAISLPKPSVIAGIFIFILLIAYLGYQHKKKIDKEEFVKSNVVKEDDPSIAWDRAIKEWQSKRAHPSGEGIRKIREAIGLAPLNWNGWKMKNLSCISNALIDTSKSQQSGAAKFVITPINTTSINVPKNTVLRTWSCNASYIRSKSGSLNRDMLSSVPDNWTINFEPLNKLVATWSLTETLPTIVISDLKDTQYHMLETTSRLQELSPLLEQDITIKFENLSIDPPILSTGSSYEKIPSVPSPKVTSIFVKGPLRSIDAMTHSGIPIDWISIDLKPSDSTTDTTNKSSINSSVLIAEITGVMYAK